MKVSILIKIFVTLFMKKIKKLSLARGLLYTKCNGYGDSYNRNNTTKSRHYNLVG